jgi:predicted nucleotidyltransferase
MIRNPYAKAIEIVRKVLKNFDYVMIGAQAVNTWVIDEDKVRATRDIDFLLDASEESAMNICQKFRDAGYTAHLRMGKKSDEIPLYIRLSSIIYPQIDIIFALKPWEKEIVKGGKRLKDFNIKIASIEDLILLKVVAGSDRDYLDIKNLISDRQAEINLKIVKKKILGIDKKLSKRLKFLKS